MFIKECLFVIGLGSNGQDQRCLMDLFLVGLNCPMCLLPCGFYVLCTYMPEL